MRVVIDIEANGLENPTKVWLVVAKDIDSGEFHIFKPFIGDEEIERCRTFFEKAEEVVGHNILEYDLPVLSKLCNIRVNSECRVRDTLIISRLVDYSRASGHSIESYGEEFGFPKGIPLEDGSILSSSAMPSWFFSKYSEEMEKYCVRDVEIGSRVHSKYLDIINDPNWGPSLELEHSFQGIVNSLHNNGFCFNTSRATVLLAKVEKELKELDEAILSSFPPKLKPIREVHPKVTKHGTLSRTDFRFVSSGDLSDYNGGPFTRCEWSAFNPSSHKQLIEVLHNAGWRPTSKTKTHIDLERELQRLKYTREPQSQVDIEVIRGKLKSLEKYGFKINEENLATLPSTAPSPAKSLARRILLESRRRTLTEWLSLVTVDQRIHGKFVGIGAWTHRMAHQNPNTANIPGEFQLDGSKKLYGKEMRQLWCAPKNRLLVGVDAEGIQLRIFAHYIDDPEFTRALVEGKKDDKTDPHSLNQRVIGPLCKSRSAAKRFIYALLLGAGLGKLSEILECSSENARQALDNILAKYQGFAHLKQEVIPKDARRGYFHGLDGRKVNIPAETDGARKHLCMSGYLQNGEAIVMKKACLLWHKQLEKEYGTETKTEHLVHPRVELAANGVLERVRDRSSLHHDIQIVNFVHDEWQTEVPNDMKIAMHVAKIQADSLRIVGEELGLKCPLAGSYWNDDHKDYTIGTNWYQTH
jgi:DNA polymerase I